MPGRIATTAIHQHKYGNSIRVKVAAMTIPPLADRVARKLAGIPTGANGDVGFILTVS